MTESFFSFNTYNQPLFHATLDGYDLVIKLHKKKVNDWLGHDFTKPLVSIQQRKPFIPHADYNPVASYLHELRVRNFTKPRIKKHLIWRLIFSSPPTIM